MDRRRTAFALAFAAAGFLLGGTSLALASSGGVSTGEQEATSADSGYQMLPFGDRSLRRGNRGDDVKTLNWLLRAEELKAPFDGDFLTPTHRAVRKFQARVGQRRTGVVKRGTRKAIAKRMEIAPATWYGPASGGAGRPAERRFARPRSASPTRPFLAAPGSPSPTTGAGCAPR